MIQEESKGESPIKIGPELYTPQNGQIAMNRVREMKNKNKIREKIKEKVK